MNDFEGFVGPFSKHPMVLVRNEIRYNKELYTKSEIQLSHIQNSAYPIVLLRDLKSNNTKALYGASVGYKSNSDAEREVHSRIRNSRFPIVLMKNLNRGSKKALCTENIGPKKVQESAETILAPLRNELDLILKKGEKKLAFLQAELIETTFKYEDSSFQCFICDYKTKCERHAKTHALIHCDIKIFNCSECVYSSSRKDRFTLHFKKHMSQFSVHREISNKEKDASEEEWNRNISNSQRDSEGIHTTSKHNPETEKSAGTILATLKNKLDLTLKKGEGKLIIMQAELIETTFKCEDNAFQCFICSYKTKYKDYAKGHALKHCDTKIFNCSECGYGTNRKNRFKLHFKKHMSQFSVHRDKSNKEKDSSEKEWNKNISNSERDSEDVHMTSKYNSVTGTKCEGSAEENSQINSDDRLQDTKFDFDSNEKDQLDLNKHNSKLFTCLKCNFKTSVEVLNSHKLKHWSKFKCLRCDYITDCNIHLSAASSSEENEARGHFLTNDVKESNSDCNIENDQEVIRSCFSDPNDTEFDANENISSPENIQEISNEQYMEILSPAIKDVRDQIFGLTIRVVGDSFQCFQCTYETKRKYNAKEHALVHSGVKLFNCRECDFGTNRAVTLKRHLDAHRFSSPSEKTQKCNASPYKKGNTNETVIDTSSSLVCYKEKLSCKSNYSVCKRMKKDETVTDSLTFASPTKDVLNNSDFPSDKRMPEFATDIRVPFSSPEKVNSYKSSFPICNKLEQEHKIETVDTLSFVSSEKEIASKSNSPIGKRKRQEDESPNSSSLFSKKKRQENEDAFDLQALLSSVVRREKNSWVCSICNSTAVDSWKAKRHAMAHFPERVSELLNSVFNVKNGKFECLICLYSTRKRREAKYHSLTHFKRNVDEDKTNEKDTSKTDRDVKPYACLKDVLKGKFSHTASEKNEIEEVTNGKETSSVHHDFQLFASFNDAGSKSSRSFSENDEHKDKKERSNNLLSLSFSENDEYKEERSKDLLSLSTLSENDEHEEEESKDLLSLSMLSTRRAVESDLLCDYDTRDLQNVQRHVHSSTKEASIQDTLNNVDEIDGDEASRAPVVRKLVEIAEDDEERLGAIKRRVFEATFESAANGYYCRKCNYETKRKSHAVRHAFTHSDIKLFKCSDCKYGTNRSDVYKRHLIKHKAELARIVNEESRDVELLESTFRVVEGSFQCCICNYETRMMTCATAHSLTHSETQSFYCPQCDYNTDKEQMYNKHLRTHESNTHTDKTDFELHRIYMCSHCDWTTSCFDDFQRHLASHDRAKQLHVGDSANAKHELNHNLLTSSKNGEETNQQVVPQPRPNKLVTDFEKVFIKEEPEIPEAMELDPLDHDIFHIKEELLLSETAEESQEWDN